METLPKCPLCENGFIPETDPRKHHRKPCEKCKGRGFITLYTLECIIREEEESKLILECEVKNERKDDE